MENISKYLQSDKKFTTLISIVNLVCEISEGSKTKKNGTIDKHVYAVQMFQAVVTELRAQGKISETLYFRCKNLTPDNLDDAIVDTIALWNRVVPLYKRLRRLLCCRK